MQMVAHRRPHWEVASPGQVGFAVTLGLMALTVPSPRKPSQHHRPQCMAGHKRPPAGTQKRLPAPAFMPFLESVSAGEQEDHLKTSRDLGYSLSRAPTHTGGLASLPTSSTEFPL